MGMRGNRANRGCKKVAERWTEKKIQDVLEQHYLTTPHFLVENLYIFDWESDFLAKTKAGYWYEVEIKISLADFKNDAKHKVDKFQILGADAVAPGVLRPNYFSYCVPYELVEKVKDLLPPYAGLYYVHDGHFLGQYRAPKQIHQEKISDEALRLSDKFYYNFINYKHKYERRNVLFQELRETISWLKAEYKAATGYDISETL